MRKLIVVASVAASLLLGCDQKSTEKRKTLSEALVAKSLSDMVAVQGGEFLMGDFGPLVGEKLPFSINLDDKVLHKVVLSDFLISKYKVINKNYKEYTKLTNKRALPVGPFMKNHPSLLSDDYSANVTWQQAKDYCQWLGKESGKKLICRQRRNGSMQQDPEGSIFRLLPTMVSFYPGKISRTRTNWIVILMVLGFLFIQ